MSMFYERTMHFTCKKIHPPAKADLLLLAPPKEMAGFLLEMLRSPFFMFWQSEIVSYIFNPSS